MFRPGSLNPHASFRRLTAGAPKEGAIVSLLPLPNERTSQAALNASQRGATQAASDPPHA
eukprot:9226625-Pyramimonas_sp.AAC.1